MSGQRGVLAGLMAVWLMSFSSVAAAANNGDTTTVTISGTLLEPPPECTFGDNNHIHIDFGDEIITHQVNEAKYLEEIPFTLTCNNLTSQRLAFIFKGTPTSFNDLLFSTSNPRLGIVIISSPGAEVRPNTELAFTYGEPPKLIAGLYDDHSATPLAGYFTAAITVVIAYQ